MCRTLQVLTTKLGLSTISHVAVENTLRKCWKGHRHSGRNRIDHQKQGSAVTCTARRQGIRLVIDGQNALSEHVHE